MSLANDVDLAAVAAACEFFTGADLKALLYNSQLSAISETNALVTNCSSQSSGLLLLLLKCFLFNSIAAYCEVFLQCESKK